ncbi:hypothetical protein RND81_05G096100 [Saponaria officinalis]|uniref:J domain-containing protein n=1 Tax=Saponaria officinalis TaxID=3572 RepID=A0AAW1KUX9_SAPOF
MECNKDDAIKAKDIAVRKFTEKDFTGAKKFALKAQSLYPTLDGVSQLLTTLDVHVAAMNKIGDEMNFYKILGVSPFADDETIKKQYRKLLLQLHPDKNQSVGADTAFQIVSDAFSILSDKTKRSAYNSRHHIKMPQQFPSQFSVPVPKQTAGRGADQNAPVEAVFTAVRKAVEKLGVNGVHKKPAVRKAGINGVREKPGTSSSGRGKAADQNAPAEAGFTAVRKGGVNGVHEKPGPSSSQRKPEKSGAPKPPTPPKPPLPPKTPKAKKPSLNFQPIYEKDETFWTVCVRCKTRYEHLRAYCNKTLNCPNCKVGFVAVKIPTPSTFAPVRPEGNNSSTPNIETPVVKECQKRDKDVAGFVSRGEAPSKKMRETGDTLIRNNGSGVPSQPKTDNQSKHYSEAGIPNGFLGYSGRVNTNREMSTDEVRNMLKDVALVDVRKAKVTLDEKTAANAKEKVDQNERQMSKLSSTPQIGGFKLKTTCVATAIMVPNPEFYNFDIDRLELCFGPNQVWAAYDNTDGMPRFYALIHSVVSLDPFKVKISWLNSISSAEFGSPNRQTNLGRNKSCGNFFVGKHETAYLLNSFSHKIKFDLSLNDVYQIYPKEGEIWALYQNRTAVTSNNVVNSYDFVEVLENYSDMDGVYVAPINKYRGFRTVYCKQQDPKTVMHIPRQDVHRFSHLVPHHTLTGDKNPNLPMGAVELDPAALTVEPVQVNGFSAPPETQFRTYQ